MRKYLKYKIIKPLLSRMYCIHRYFFIKMTQNLILIEFPYLDSYTHFKDNLFGDCTFLGVSIYILEIIWTHFKINLFWVMVNKNYFLHLLGYLYKAHFHLKCVLFIKITSRNSIIWLPIYIVRTIWFEIFLCPHFLKKLGKSMGFDLQLPRNCVFGEKNV